MKKINNNKETMAGNKTRDGIKLTNIVKALTQIGATIRQGSNHPYVAYIEDSTRPCPIASSTDARRMVVPWVKMHSSYTDAQQIYQALRNGGFN